MVPIWLYVAVASAIALIAFGVGQLFPGLGVPFVGLASTSWTAYVMRRQQKLSRKS